MLAYGKAYSKSNGFRALAERQQRQYRAEVLKVSDDGKWGHRLCAAAAKEGKNFVSPEANDAVIARKSQGKGIDLARTRGNMLSSQAMCFNLFAPLDNAEGRKALARVLAKYAGGMGKIQKIHFEYTPAAAVFDDQSAVGGVDCDLLIEFEKGVLGIETKFVEEEFSRCGFCKSGMARKCPAEARLDASKCLYTMKKERYRYWERTNELGTVRPERICGRPCPFDGPKWQLWVNHTLIQFLAGKKRGVFAVCAPTGNEKLLGGRDIEGFRGLLTDPSTFAFIPLEQLIGELEAALAGQPQWTEWLQGLRARYVVSEANR